MSEFKTALHPQVRYQLRHDQKGVLDIDNGLEPEGWDTDLKEIIRSEEYAGVLNKLTLNLKFKKSVSDWLYSCYKTYGWKTKVYLSRFVMHPKKIEEITYYRDALLNGNTLNKSGEVQARAVEIDAQESALNEILKSKKSERIQVDVPKTLGNKNLDALIKEKVNFHGLEILLRSQYETNEDNRVMHYDTTGSGNSASTKVAKSIPLKVVNSDDPNVQNVTDIQPMDKNDTLNSYNIGRAGNMFYLVNALRS
jgi:hypothetical protein